MKSVLDADPGIVDGDGDGRELLADLGHRGGRAPIGQHEAVHDEVAVVWAFPEVAAVGVHRLAVGGEGGDPVIAPLPDEAAGPIGQRLEQLDVVADRAGTVAHGMHELAQDLRFVEIP